MTPAAGTAAVLAAGDTVTSGALPLAVVVAALAGLVSFASPCVLPLVPGFLGYVTGLTGEPLAERSRSRMVTGALLFVVGLHRGVRARLDLRHHRRAGAHRAPHAAPAGRRGARHPDGAGLPRGGQPARGQDRLAAARRPGRCPGARRGLRARLGAVHRADPRRRARHGHGHAATRRSAAACCSRRPTASGWGCRSSSSRPGSTGPVARRAGCAATSAASRSSAGSCSCSSGLLMVTGVWEDLNTLAADRARQRVPGVAVSARTEVVQPRLGPLGWLRWTWRQLTSMRTALFLLLLLAIGAIPGSTFPQRSIDPARTTAWIADHPTAGPVLDRLGFFEVYASPWFAAIYLLLFVSLIGCVLPRTRILWHQVRSAPPRAPRRLDRLAAHREVDRRRRARGGARAAARRPARAPLPRARPRRRRRSRPRRATCARPATWSSTWRSSACSSASRGATCSAGRATSSCRWARPSPTPCRATTPSAPARGSTSTTSSPTRSRSTGSTPRSRPQAKSPGQFGAPRDFEAFTTFTDADGSSEPRSIRVNGPLETGGGSVFLLGNGYAPVITVRDADGHGALLRRHAVPAAGQQLHLGRRGQGARRLDRSSSASPGSSCRPGRSTTRARTRSSPTRSTRSWRSPRSRATCSPAASPQSVYSLDTGLDDARAGQGRRRPAAHPAASPGRDLRAARRPRARSPSTGSSGSPACRSAPTRASRSPSSRPCSRSPGWSPRSSSVVEGCSCGLVRGPSRVVLWCPSAAWPRTTTKGCPTRSSRPERTQGSR